jgi:hypothetical protein
MAGGKGAFGGASDGPGDRPLGSCPVLSPGWSCFSLLQLATLKPKTPNVAIDRARVNRFIFFVFLCGFLCGFRQAGSRKVQ